MPVRSPVAMNEAGRRGCVVRHVSSGGHIILKITKPVLNTMGAASFNVKDQGDMPLAYPYGCISAIIFKLMQAMDLPVAYPYRIRPFCDAK